MLFEVNVDDATGEVLAHTIATLLARRRPRRLGHADRDEEGPSGAHRARAVRSRPGRRDRRDARGRDRLARRARRSASNAGRRPAPNRSSRSTGEPIRVKVGAGRVKAEHDDAAAAATRLGLPLREVLRRAEAAASPDPRRRPGPSRDGLRRRHRRVGPERPHGGGPPGHGRRPRPRPRAGRAPGRRHPLGRAARCPAWSMTSARPCTRSAWPRRRSRPSGSRTTASSGPIHPSPSPTRSTGARPSCSTARSTTTVAGLGPDGDRYRRLDSAAPRPLGRPARRHHGPDGRACRTIPLTLGRFGVARRPADHVARPPLPDATRRVPSWPGWRHIRCNRWAHRSPARSASRWRSPPTPPAGRSRKGGSQAIADALVGRHHQGRRRGRDQPRRHPPRRPAARARSCSWT